VNARRIAAVAAVAAALGAAPASAAEGLRLEVLSNRADLISDGNALVAVDLPAGVSQSALRVHVGKRDVTSAFSQRADGRIEGLIEGLKLGKNVVVATVPGGRGTRLTVKNHPNGGPLFTGPQPQPWKCQPKALDAQCNQPPVFTYVYRSTDSQQDGLQPYDPKSPPADVATTTTDSGATVPFVVRIETGYQDRDQYRIATLFDPSQPWTTFAPQKQFNHKLLITHGASCDSDYEVANAPSVTSYNPADLLGLPIALPVDALADSAVYALGHGYVLMSTALDNNGHNCDVTTQAESLVMAKERVIENYGQLRYTIGTGCSGGSLAQQWIANAYPGIYQGILPTCSFPDTWSSATQVMDYHLLRGYFEDPSKWGGGVLWLPHQWAAVEGNALPADAIISDIGFFSAIVPTHGCGGITDQQRYNAQTNPTGVRCSIADRSINVFGRRLPSVWSPVEQKLGHGFAGVPVDNVGVQYGLSALKSLQITPAQFVDLNAKIGGLDIDINPIQNRIVADQPALPNAYRSGMINEANNLDQTAIIDCRGPDPGAAHDSYRAFAIRARLDREHHDHRNQLIWEGPAPIVGDTQCGQTSLIAMDRWLDAVDKDTSDAPLPIKIVEDRPADLSDRCYDGQGHRLLGTVCGTPIVPVYGTPRTVAGDGMTTDANKCQLKPLDRDDYAVPFTDDEWAQLQKVFPTGVCDFSKLGVDQQGTIPWMTYQEADGKLITGGRAMPAPPVPAACRWRSKRTSCAA
jgi:Tannase-like family of unknown function (DUF6351)